MSDVLRKLFKPNWKSFQNFPKCTTTFPLNQLHGLYQQNRGKAHEKMHLFKFKLKACNNSKRQPWHLFFGIKTLWASFDVILFSRKDSHLLQVACFVVSFLIEIIFCHKQIFKKLIHLLQVARFVWNTIVTYFRTTLYFKWKLVFQS